MLCSILRTDLPGRVSDGKGGMVIKRVKPEGRAAIAGVIKVSNPPV